MGSTASLDIYPTLDFESHVSATRSETRITVASILRKRHPHHTVIEVDTPTVDLFNFARLGHATCVLDDSDPEALHRLVQYIQPQFRLSREQREGKLEDKVLFGRWTYTWERNEFLVYQAQVTTLLGRFERHDFLLTPSADAATGSSGPSVAQKLLLGAGQLTGKLDREVYIFDQGRWLKSKDLYASVQRANWTDVILPAALKSDIIENVQSFFDGQDIYAEFSVPWKRGIIFHGLPGNGKTISLTAIIAALAGREESVPSLYVKTLENCNGPAFAIRGIFEKARSTAPCLLIFEDLDSMITDKTRSYFLNEVDGLESNDGILMIGSTNHLDSLDPAIRDRPSRFDRKYHFQLPGKEQRVAYAKYWQAKLANNKNLDFPDEACAIVAQMTDGFSFAYLKELFMGSLLALARGSKGEEQEQSARESNSGTGGMSGTVTVQTEEERAAVERVLLRQQALAAVQIPEDLKGNVFLKILRRQVEGLLKEMDNSANKPKAVGKKKESGEATVTVEAVPGIRRC